MAKRNWNFEISVIVSAIAIGTLSLVGIFNAKAQPEIPQPMPGLEARIDQLKAGDVLRITKPIRIHEARDRIFDGHGGTIEYVGPADVPGIIEVAGCLNCVVRNLRIIDRSGAKAAVLLTNLPGKAGSTGCLIENVFVRHAGGEPGPKIAFSIDSHALGDADRNNDLHTLRHCASNNHSEVGVYIRGTQVHQIVIDRCNFVDYGGRHGIGVLAERSGYFTVRDSSFGHNQIDICCKGPTERIILDGINSEHSRQLFVGDTVGSTSFTSIGNVRFDGEPQPGVPVVKCHGDGPFRFSNGYLRGLNGVNPTMQFDHYGDSKGTFPGSVSFSGWWIMCHSLTPTNGPEVSIPKTWKFEQFGSRHLRITIGNWPRRDLRIIRP